MLHSLSGLSSAIAALFSPWMGPLGTLIAGLAAWWAKKALTETKAGNVVAAAAVVAAEGAQVAAVEARTELADKVDNLATQAIPLAHQAGERKGYVGGIEVGKRQATQPGDLQ